MKASSSSKRIKLPPKKVLAWTLVGIFFLGGLVRGSFENPAARLQSPLTDAKRQERNLFLSDLDRINLLGGMPMPILRDLLDYQTETGKTIAQILQEPSWRKRMGFSADQFKATWYVANPYELLPHGLQDAIRKKKTCFKSPAEMKKWMVTNHTPYSWRRALSKALIETTPENLWRASRGYRPYAKNGELLEPIVVDHGNGDFELRNGHIATDPTIIPTNSYVYLLLRIKGEDRIVRVKATDIGGAIKGCHIDLPITLSARAKTLPHTVFPSEIRNPLATVLTRRS